MYQDRLTLYTYHSSRKEAVQTLIEREQAAIALAEKELARHKKRLATFIKKHVRE